VRKYRKRLYRQLGVTGATDILVGLIALSLRHVAGRST
jgi:DNA-binding CsgD family transcriptional regulator